MSSVKELKQQLKLSAKKPQKYAGRPSEDKFQPSESFERKLRLDRTFACARTVGLMAKEGFMAEMARPAVQNKSKNPLIIKAPPKEGNKPSLPEQKKLSVLTSKYLDIEAARLEFQKEFYAEKCRRLSAYTANQWKLESLQQQASRPKRRLDGDDVGVGAQPSAPKKRKLLSC
ncbi:hypothetical protein CU097_011316 [Rhizopus azygosporus]|uniref:Uncharacterized protein n=1 Tax=Rhizopus azygosporus TaxID=86630 RepID=A0A367JNW6_RHIAZ|nr:hypothetical protein CU097_011316 [Rhizopus azygosporus]